MMAASDRPGGTPDVSGLLRAAGFSIVFHALLLLLMTVINHAAVRVQRPLVIDFSLNSQWPEESAGARTAGAAAYKSPGIRKHSLIRERTQPVADHPPTESSDKSETHAAQHDETTLSGTKVKSGPVFLNKSGSGMGIGSGSGGDKSESTREGTGRGADQVKYLKEHFAYIKDMVRRHVTYPAIARRMGWEGRAVISFVIAPDGTVKELKVMESSGRDSLNNSAIDAVRKSSPFPRPPVEAEIILPVDFRLN